jgi:hypothetical protein
MSVLLERIQQVEERIVHNETVTARKIGKLEKTVKKLKIALAINGAVLILLLVAT